MPEIEWPWFEANHAELGEDPCATHPIINVDWPVRIAPKFHNWQSENCPLFDLACILAKCASDVQFENVLLNKPAKNYLMQEFTNSMTEHLEVELAPGEDEIEEYYVRQADLNAFALAVCLPAMNWTIDAGEMLERLNDQAGLQRMGNLLCLRMTFGKKQEFVSVLSSYYVTCKTFCHQAQELKLDDQDLAMAGDLKGAFTANPQLAKLEALRYVQPQNVHLSVPS